ncbi:MAG: hypothetical protein ABIK84_03590 [candidate division WOR-3 bacterium]
MRSCPKERVLFFLENLLSEKEREDFLSHLKICGTCQEELRRYQRLKELLAVGEGGIPVPNFSRLLSHFRKKRSRSKKRLAWRLVFLPVAALAVILLLLSRPSPEVYLPLDLSYYEIIEEIPTEVKEELAVRLLKSSDLEKLEEEILTSFDYFTLIENLGEEEKEVLVKRLIGGEL